MFEAHEMVLFVSILHSIFAGPSPVLANSAEAVAALWRAAAEAPLQGVQQCRSVAIVPEMKSKNMGLGLVAEPNASHHFSRRRLFVASIARKGPNMGPDGLG